MNRKMLIEELRRDEGVVLHEYKDHLGYSTIGIGRLIDKRRGGGITLQEAEYLLGNDVDKVYSELKARLPWFVEKPDYVQRALCNMAFQMGIEGLLKFKNTLQFIKSGNYSAAADNALKSKWATHNYGLLLISRSIKI
jgi:lysozyme